MHAPAATAVMHPARMAPLRVALARTLRHIEYAFVVAALSVFAGSMNALVSRLGFWSIEDVVDTPRQLFLPPIYLFSICALLLRPAGILTAALRSKATLLLTGMAILSFSWSAAPMLSVKRSVMLAGLTLFSLYLVSRFDQREFLRLLSWTLGIVAVASVATVLLVPGVGIAHGIHEGAWTGIYAEKNGFGRYMALGALAFVALAMTRRRSHVLWLGALLCGSLVVLSRSATALVSLVCALSTVFVLPLLRRRGATILAVIVTALPVVAIGALAAVVNLDKAVSVVGKDASLSGRVPLWLVLVERIWERPVFGAGYNAFWVGENGAPAARGFEATGWWAPWQAHNGFIELALELGLLAIVVFLIGYLSVFVRAVRVLRDRENGPGFWPLAYLVFMLVTSVAESMLLRYNSLWWATYLVVAFSPLASPGRAPEALASDRLPPVRARPGGAGRLVAAASTRSDAGASRYSSGAAL